MRINRKVFQSTFKNAMKGVKKAGPTLCIILGVGAFGVAIYEAIDASHKAEEAINEAEAEKGEELTPKEKVKVSWKYYIRPGVAIAIGTGFIFGGYAAKVSSALAAEQVCLVTKEALNDVRAATVEMVGKEQADKIFEKADEIQAKRRVEEIDSRGPSYIKDKFVEYYTGQILYTSEAEVERACRILCETTPGDEAIDLNDFFTMTQRNGTQMGRKCEGGKHFQWCFPETESLFPSKTPLISPVFDSTFDDEGRPCYLLKFYPAPAVVD